MKQYLTESRGWFEFYARQFCKTGSETSAQLALWYMLLGLQREEDWCSDRLA